MVAYIDFFLGGDEKRLDVATTVLQRFPMCIIFGGDGSFMSPYCLHSDMLLTNLLGQVVIVCAMLKLHFYSTSSCIHLTSLLMDFYCVPSMCQLQFGTD